MPYRVRHATSSQASLSLRRLFCCTNKSSRRFVPLLLLTAKDHARFACPLRCASLQRCRRAFDHASPCSVVNALAAPPLHYQSLAVCACGAIDNLNAVHIRGKAACSALLPMSWQSEAAPYRVKHAKKPPIHCAFGISVLCCADCIVTIFSKSSEPYSIVLPFTIKSESSVLPFLGCLHLTPADVLIQRRTVNIDKLYDFDVLYIEMFSVIKYEENRYLQCFRTERT